MKIEPQQIAQEIRELIGQYQREVPGRRRAWPESIKVRIAHLGQSGWSPRKIATETGISYYSVLRWVPKEYRRQYGRRKKSSNLAEFAPVRIQKSHESVRVTVAQSTIGIKPTNSSTVTVALRGGIRIKGVTPEFLRAWLGGRS